MCTASKSDKIFSGAGGDPILAMGERELTGRTADGKSRKIVCEVWPVTRPVHSATRFAIQGAPFSLPGTAMVTTSPYFASLPMRIGLGLAANSQIRQHDQSLEESLVRHLFVHRCDGDHSSSDTERTPRVVWNGGSSCVIAPHGWKVDSRSSKTKSSCPLGLRRRSLPLSHPVPFFWKTYDLRKTVTN